MKPNHYQNFQQASDSNWSLLVDLFSTSKKFKLIRPSKVNSVFDGILSCKKDDGTDVIILVEVKRRQFTSETLRNEFNSVLFLEKDKYKYLHKRAAEYAKVPNREIKIWYLSKTSDGAVWIHDIFEKDYAWVSVKMNNVTYSETQEKKDKKVALLHTSDAIFNLKTTITN